MAEPFKRNVAGEADPETRRRFLTAALRSGPPVKTTSSVPKPADTSASAFDAARDLGRRGVQINMAVDDPEGSKRRQRAIEQMRGVMKK